MIAMSPPLSSCTNTIKQQDSIVSISPQKIAPEHIFGMAEGEEYAYYKGGQGELMDYIKKNTRYPSKTISISGRVIVQFIINEDGSASNFEIRRGLHPLFDKEALRVASLMPQKWSPGKQNGKLIKVKFFVPITFYGEHIKVKETQIIETGTKSEEDSDVRVKGRVMDKEGRNVTDAFIYDAENREINTYSKSDGCFEIYMPRNHRIIVTYPYVETQNINIHKYKVPYINVVLVTKEKK